LDVGDISVLSVQLANQDTGVMQDIRAVSDLCMSVGVPLHVDASVAFGVEPIDMEEMGIDFLTLSSHKVWGPLGAGALVGNGRFQLSPLLLGGSQEKGMRAGATNMAAIIGFTTASRIMHGKRMEWNRVGRVRDKMEAQLATACNARSIGKNRLPNMSMVSFDADATFIAAEMERMHGMCVGVGGTSESGSISRVLRAMGETRTSCGGALRFRFGPWFNDNAADMIVVGASSAIREERGRKIV
jgi:cysteine desulfurase